MGEAAMKPSGLPAPLRIDLAPEAVASFCRKWHIAELALFGSVLRPDFTPESDVDVLVTFAPEARWSLFDFVTMRDELESLVQREVDLVSKGGLRNPFRRHEILTTRRVLYAA
jgi:predicted nucleotidyltransferase